MTLYTTFLAPLSSSIVNVLNLLFLLHVLLPFFLLDIHSILLFLLVVNRSLSHGEFSFIPKSSDALNDWNFQARWFSPDLGL